VDIPELGIRRALH